MPHAKKLRDYVDRGGFIFAEACCSDSQPIRRRLPPADGRRLSRARIPTAAAHARPSDLADARPGAARFALRRPAVGRRIRLPHVRRLLRPKTCRATGSSPSPASGTTIPRRSSNTSPMRWPIGVNVLTYATNREPKGKEQSFVTPLAEDDVGDDGRPRRHRNRQAPPRRRLQRRARRAREPAPHRLARRAEAASPRRARADQHLATRTCSATTWCSCTAGTTSASPTPNASSFASTSSAAARCWPTRSARAKPFADRLPPRTRRRAARPTDSSAFPPDDPLFTTAYGGFDIRHVTLRDPQAADDGQPARRPLAASRAAARRHPDSTAAGPSSSRPTTSAAPGKPRSPRLPRLHPTRRRPHRPQRAAVFAESMSDGKKRV